jgi:hypothetical protein
MRTLSRCLLLVTVCSLLAGLAAAGEKESIKLFNGKDFEGLTFYLRDNAKPEDTWSVKDGVIQCTGKPAGYFRTKEKYTNYELTLEWRFDPAKGAGNSGVLLRLVGEDKIWPKSIEAQLHSGNAGDIWNIDNVKMKVAADRTEGRRTRKMKPSNEKPLGEWNHYRIVVNKGDVRLYVNGELQNAAEDAEVVAGHIGFQSEGAYIEFRNIVLTPIKD